MYGRAQLTVSADANGGDGVDIVGDTTFKGRLDVRSAGGGARTEINNERIEVYDANGVLRVQIGLF
ncbi:MAG TPA: hypothetical protein VF637_14165 [Sphingomicrobium sp.]